MKSYKTIRIYHKNLAHVLGLASGLRYKDANASIPVLDLFLTSSIPVRTLITSSLRTTFGDVFAMFLEAAQKTCTPAETY